MRILAVVVLLMTFSLPCLADLGTCYSVRASIVTTKGTYNGYFLLFNDGWFYFQKDSSGYVYNVLESTGRISIEERSGGQILLFGADQQAFAKSIIPFLPDTITLYPAVHYIYFSEDGSDVAATAGAGRKISRNDIKRINIRSFHECSTLYYSATPLNGTDTWVTGKAFKVESLGQVQCSYYALYFSTPDASSQSQVKEFQKVTQARERLPMTDDAARQQYGKLQNKASELIALLKQKRVIIFYTCSC
jgi:hypothetical protein